MLCSEDIARNLQIAEHVNRKTHKSNVKLVILILMEKSSLVVALVETLTIFSIFVPIFGVYCYENGV